MKRSWFRSALAVACVVTATLAGAGAARATCGDGNVEAGEDCDDGNQFGSDGCAANCTNETDRQFLLDPSVSGATIGLALFPLPLTVTGEAVLTTGEAGDDGIIPVSIRANSLSVEPILVPGLACVCLAGAENEEFGPGNAGAGVIGCGAAGLADINLSTTRDHNLGVPAAECEARGGTLDTNPVHANVCNGPAVETRSGTGVPGSALISISLAATLNQGAACPPGPDGIPCSGDEGTAALTVTATGTTGTAVASIENPNNSLTAPPLTLNASGHPFDCDALEANPTGGTEGAILAGAGATIDLNLGALGFQDIILVNTLGSPLPCGGDCNEDGEVTVDELVLAVNILLGLEDIEDCEALDVSEDGEITVDEVVLALTHSRNDCADCGDGTVEGDETCDDGNTFGGDGCASNCTEETRVSCTFGEGTQSTVQTRLFPIVLRASGHQTLTGGRPRASEGNGQIPVVIKVEDTRFEPVEVPGIACACVRGVEVPEFGPGISAQGVLACGNSGLEDVNYELVLDHNIRDVDPNCETGTPDTAAGHQNACNGRPVLTFSGHGRRGSSRLTASTGITLIMGSCAPVGAGDPNRPQGADGVPCTDDDPNQAGGNLLPTTTGTASARILDATNAAGAVIGVGATCGAAPCVAQAVGAPVNCDLLETDPNAALSGSALVGAAAFLDAPSIGDNVLTNRFVCQ